MEEKIRKSIDFNCDITRENLENNEEFDFLDYVSSVNIPCAFTEKDPAFLKKAVEHCKFKNKVIGASISLEGIENPEELTEDEIESIVLYQLGAVDAFARVNSLVLEYVRPVGIMYELAAKNSEFSIKVAKAVKKFGNWLLYCGAAGESIEKTAQDVEINIIREVRIDKSYNSEGQLDYSDENTLEVGHSLIRLRRLMNLSEIELSDGEYKKFDFDTIYFEANNNKIEELLKESVKIVEPRPVNYNKALPSGWV